jgi:hypothetical protein
VYSACLLGTLAFLTEFDVCKTMRARAIGRVNLKFDCWVEMVMFLKLLFGGYLRKAPHRGAQRNP